MTEITLTIAKDEVYREVAMTSAYTGSKMKDPEAYQTISTTDEDKEVLERFWNESKNIVCDNLKKVLLSADEYEIDHVSKFTLQLGLSDSFDTNLVESMQSSLFSFFVMNIVSKWYTFCNKPESTDYATDAAGCIEDIKRKAFFKKKPKRPTYN